MEKKSWILRMLEKIRNQKIYMTFLSFLILLHTAFYLSCHYEKEYYKGIELIRLTPQEIEYAVIKLDIPVVPEVAVPPAVPVPTVVLAVKDSSVKVIKKTKRDSIITAHIDDIKFMLLRHYNRVDTTDLRELTQHYKSLLPKASYSQIESERLKVRSYFFLTGSRAYFEIVCWTIFGVLASLLYYVSAVIRDKETTFDPEQIPSQLSKLFYAPLVTLIIIFGYQQFTTGGIEIDTSKGILIVSFLLGFYSGRAMELLNRAKEVVLPYTSTLLPGDTLTSTSGNFSAIIVNLNVDPNGLPRESDFELISNQLPNAEVKLIDTVTEETTLLTNGGDDQDATFAAKAIKPGNYKLVGELTTEEGLHLIAEELIDLTQSQTIDLMLKFTSTAG